MIYDGIYSLLALVLSADYAYISMPFIISV